MTVLRGVELDGVLDILVESSIDSPTVRSRRELTGGIVLRPSHGRERWIAGAEARSIVGADGRYDDAHEVIRSLADVLAPGRRAPRAENEEETVLSAHLAALLSGPARRTVLLVPDTLREEAQQRLATALRAASHGVTELLWRPVAAILAWSGTMTNDQVRALDGRSVLHLHAGAHAVQASRFELAVEEVDDVPYLVPIRSGRGRDGPATCLVERFRSAAVDADVATFELDETGRRAVAMEERAWNAAIGRPAREAIVPTAAGGFRLLRGAGDFAAPDASEEADFLGEAAETAASSTRASSTPAVVLVDGTATGVRTGRFTLGEEVARRVGVVDASIIVLAPGDAATGAAVYAWRREHGLPTYEDVLPRLRIFARAEGRPAWVDLVPPDQRVRGGTTYGPRRVDGFGLGQGTQEVRYAITREDDPTVRLTTTRLPTEAPRYMEVELVVTQRPGQGHAAVEIRPRVAAEELAWPGVYLNWSSMEDTSVEPDAYLESEIVQGGLAYPEIAPFPCHGRAWEVFDVAPTVYRFLRASPRDDDFGSRVRELVETLGKKLDPDADGFLGGGPATHGAIGSDGDAPEWPIWRGVAPERLLSDLVEAIDADMAELESVARPTTRDRAAYRRTLLSGAWCYAAAPPRVLDFARRALQRPESLPSIARREKHYAANVAGRSFAAGDDIARLFAHVDDALRSSRRVTNPWMKALQEVLRFREHAYAELDGPMAARFARMAISVMRSEVAAENVKQKFFNAAALLVGLLRFRIVDPAFLAPGNAGGRAVRQRAEGRPERSRVGRRTLGRGDLDEALQVLADARDVARRTGRSRIDGLIEEIGAYLEMRGTDTLLFRRLLDEGDS